MVIQTPTEEGEPILKQVVVGGGVKLRIDGQRTTVWVKVLSLDPSGQALTVEYDGSTQTIAAFGIIDALNPQAFEYQMIMESQPDPGAA